MRQSAPRMSGRMARGLYPVGRSAVGVIIGLAAQGAALMTARVSSSRRFVLAFVVASLAAAAWLPAQQAALSPAEQQRRKDLERELQSIAVVERKVMMPMRDGVRLATDIYRPKDATGPVPVVFSKTPYNFNYWDVRNRVPRDMSTALMVVKKGYAYVVQNERGHFFSEGNYDILGAPITDGYDAIDWLGRQAWSNGKVGTTGCSSTAEWQPAVAALGHPGFAAMNVQGFGAGVGRVGPYCEQGNWYRGGAVQMLFIAWLYGEQNQVRPQFPMETRRRRTWWRRRVCSTWRRRCRRSTGTRCCGRCRWRTS